MTTDISPFELHLILKFENGQELTPNEIRKAQKLGIDYPWAAGQGRQPENTNNENEGGDEIGQKKQKQGDSSSLTGDDAQQKVPLVNPVQKCWFPRCPHTQSRSGGCWPGCGYAATAPTARYGQYRPPDWARETRRYPNGAPIPRNIPPDDEDGRLDTRIWGRYAMPDAPTARYGQYQPPDWARETRRYPNGAPIPRTYPRDDQDGRLDTRIWGRYAMPDAPTARYGQYQPPDWARETRRYPNGAPIPRTYPRDDQDGRLDTRIWGRYAMPDAPTARYGQYRPPDWARETRRYPNGAPIPRNIPPDDEDGRLDTRIWGRFIIPDWKVHPERYPRGPPIPPWVPIQYLAQPTEHDQLADSTPLAYDPNGGYDGADAHEFSTSAHWAQPAQAYPHYIPVDGADRHPRAHYQYPYHPPTRTFPTHIPDPFGFPDRNWRQVITTSPGGDDADAAKLNGSVLQPSQTYAWPGTGVGLRIGTGGSDQSGLLVKLLDKYIQECVEVKQETPFLVEFYSSDSAVTIDYLTENVIDLGFTDTILLDTLLKDQGIADRRETGWRDHWMLVGPKDNPIGLPEKAGTTSVHALFATIYTKLQADPDGPTIFLSRSDASSSYVKESSIWSAIGRTPSTSSTATWYASSGSSAADTLAEAAMIGAYTLTDSDTWLSASEEIRGKLATFTTVTDEDKFLVKPAELVVGSSAKNKDRANDFVDWVIGEDGGQEVIKAFKATRTEVPPAVGPSDAATETSSKTATAINSAA